MSLISKNDRDLAVLKQAEAVTKGNRTDCFPQIDLEADLAVFENRLDVLVGEMPDGDEG